VVEVGTGVLITILPLFCCHWYPHHCAFIVIDVAISTCDPTSEQSLAAGGWVLGCLDVILVVVVVVIALL